MDTEEGHLESPWRVGLESVRANAVPGLVLQAAAVALVLAYFLAPGFAEACRPVLDWQKREGPVASFLSRAFFCGLLPGLFMIAVPSLRPRRVSATVCANVFWWGMMGVTVHYLYLGQEAAFGPGRDFMTLLKKTAVDQFVYTVLFASPMNSAFNFWLGRDLSWAAARRAWPRRWVRELVLPNLLPNWTLWIPALFAIYALPEPLQIHLSGLVACFWALMCMQIGRRVKAD